MSYGFNDDKSKVQIYTKGDFAVVKGTANNVLSDTTKDIYISQNQLSYCGIDDIKNYTVISVMCGTGTNDNPTRLSTSQYIDNDLGVFPCADIIPSDLLGPLRVGVFNHDVTTRNIIYRVVLMKIK